MTFLCSERHSEPIPYIGRVHICQKVFVSAVLLFIIATISADSCFAAQKSQEILVSTAISLKDAFKDIGKIFENQTGIVVRLNLGASGLLQKQIEAGAPADVFASAGQKQMDELQTLGLIISETRCDFAGNSLVLAVPTRANVSLHAFAELARSDITRVAIGNPKTVPAGQYAQEVLKNLHIWNNLESRLVLAENVRQVLDYVEREEVDAGIVFASDMAIARGKAIIAADAPKESHSPILYPIAVVQETGNRNIAQRFIDLTMSSAGQEVLKKYGFLSPR